MYFFRIQKALMEQNELRKQLENCEHEVQLQKNELMNNHAEKLTLIKVYHQHFLRKNFTVFCTLILF